MGDGWMALPTLFAPVLVTVLTCGHRYWADDADAAYLVKHPGGTTIICWCETVTTVPPYGYW